MRQPRIILQSQATECGLACLAIVADAHGAGLGLRELRQRFPVSAKGTTLQRLIEIAGELKLRGRALRLDLSQLPRLALPCVLHWDLNHFVVLTDLSSRHAVVLDPAVGRRRLPLSALSQHFTGVALELAPASDFTRAPPKPTVTFRQLTGPITGLKRSLGLVLLLSLVLQLFVAIAPFYIQWVVDQVLVSADRNLLFVLAIGFTLALVVQSAVVWLRGTTVVLLSTRLGLQWVGNLHAHLLKLPLEFFEKRHVGDVTSRMGAAQSIQKTLTVSTVEALVDGLMAAVTLAMMAVYSVKLMVVSLAAVGLYLGARIVAYSYTRERTEHQLIVAAKQQSHLLESLRGIQSLKVANRETMRGAVYENLMVVTANHDIWLARAGIAFASVNQLVFGIERIVVVLIAASMALDSTFSVGMLVAYLAYRELFAQRVAALIDKGVEFRMLRLFGERLADIALTPPERASVGPQGDIDLRDAHIVVEHLSFRYADDEPWVIHDCSFRIEAGESVAITGPSGCGKTTLMKLLLGLLTPTSGSISIGGQDMSKIAPPQARAHFGAVLQDDQLFAGTIAENISFFDESNDPTQVVGAAILAGIHDEIDAMPMRYQTVIGDMGNTLSGGQKQRIILARALFRRPRILFLDEATSHLDVDRERLVNEAVRSLAITKVIVAHRPETVASADRTLILQRGSVVSGHGTEGSSAHRASHRF
ncbi:ABC transporter transmembrane region family protein [Lysobacter antibioticus]|uniref:peptidase domain-containing ABC transporter n=1 Tax=Lysobacter antibioticus TaxID=84531 RepID=UPI0007172CE0|nr:peptidase domain-containing ABC transporter [Lysobacter antibioticus]ALN64554.1 ABC transporter transmembrane region family protein [Lysobacter antibioticus]